MSIESNPPLEDHSIASELLSARGERGISQAQLADLSGVSRSAIKGYESGRNVPGGREIRALCKALNVTPNRLLFGSEAPGLVEGDVGKLEAILRSDPEDQAVARARLAAYASLLTTEEVAALLHIVRSIAVARHGIKKVNETVGGMDAMSGIMRLFMQHSLAAAQTGPGSSIDPAKFAVDFEDFLARQGHKPVGAPPP